MKRLAGIVLLLGLGCLGFGLVKAIPTFFADPLTEISAAHLYAGYVPSHNVTVTGFARQVAITAGSTDQPDAISYVPIIFEGMRASTPVRLVALVNHAHKAAFDAAGGHFRGTLTQGVDHRVVERFADAGIKVDGKAWLLDYADDPVVGRHHGFIAGGVGLGLMLLALALARARRARAETTE
jgi:hypothetical protein